MNLKKHSWLISLIILIILVVLFVNIDKIFNFSLPTIDNPYERTQNNLNQDIPDVELINNPEGPLVEEFSDFQCIYCAQAHPAIKFIRAKYNNQINFQYKHLPNVQIHPDSLNAANAAECARDQDKFEEYHDILFENQDNLAVEDLMTYAENLNLNMEDFRTCYNSAEKIPIIQKDLDEAIERGVLGTPSFFVDGEQVFIDQLDRELEKLLN